MPTYSQLLESPFWLTTRKAIKIRDNHTCQICGNVNLFENHLTGISKFIYLKKDDDNYDIAVYELEDNNIENKRIYIPLKLNLPQSELYIWYTIIENHNLLLAARLKSNTDSLKLSARKSLFHHKAAIEILEAKIKNVPEYSEVNLSKFIEEIDQEEKFNPSDWLYIGGLHVHHTYYQDNKLPWEYPDDSFLTYCYICHEKHHKDKKIPHLDKNGNQVGFLTPCYRCHGAGILPQYMHVQNGICFNCQGAKYQELIQ